MEDLHQWKLINQLFEEAIELPPSEQLAAVRLGAEGDEVLEQQVLRLLTAHAAAESFMIQPAGNLADFASLLTSVSALQPGVILADRFKISRFIGQGGMGAVYEAWDSELQDVVALKTIRPGIFHDRHVIDQFKEEVRVARGIAHPNICRVYDLYVHELDSRTRLWFLTMEFIAGDTLASELRRHGPLRRRAALDLARQMTSGLAAAHELGVVHRDFKSNNIMLVPGKAGKTRLVITDFGLAFRSATQDYSRAQAGGQGTPDYMAPEQSREGPVGPAADQYALGVTLFEMLTGTRPTRKVISADGRTCALLPARANIPRRLRNIISRCLEYRPQDRFPSVQDVLLALQPVTSRYRKSFALTTIAVPVGCLIAVIVFFPTSNTAGRISELLQLTPQTDLSDGPSLSNDGNRVAYSSDRGTSGTAAIWIQDLPAGRPQKLTMDPYDNLDPAISPDGTQVAYRTSARGGGVSIVSISTGSTFAFLPGGRNPAFSPDGQLVAYWIGDPDSSTGAGKIFLYSVASASSNQVAPLFRDARRPVWSGDGQHILFSGCDRSDQAMPACAEWWVTDRWGRSITNTHALSQLRALGIQVRGGADWHTERILFSGRKNASFSLWELPVSKENFQVTRPPTQVTAGDSSETSPAISPNGRIAFVRLSGALHLWQIDRVNTSKPATEELSSDAALDICPYVSHNGRWLVFSRAFSDSRGIWVRDLHDGIEVQLKKLAGEIFSPLVSEAGDSVVYEARTKDSPAIFFAKAGEVPTRLCAGCNSPTDWLEEENGVLHQSADLHEIKLLHLDSGRDDTLAADATSALGDASWAPETRLLAFTKSSAGVKQILYVFMPRLAISPSQQWHALTSTSETAERPRWSGDGKNLFYMSTRDGSLCLWRQRFESGRPTGTPIAVQHYHAVRRSPAIIIPRSFNLSVADNMLYLNLPESASSIWTGTLALHRRIFGFRPTK